MSQVFDFDNLVELCRRTHEETQRSAARTVDISLVVRNWLFGKYIVEYEQHGADRAEYGSQLLAKIASRLQRIGIKGSSVTRLKLYLYERLALSRDKEEVRRLASEGQVIEKASDLIKNPLVLEFLGLEEKPVYSESELETAIIDRLQHFLLELGKGFLFEARQKRFTFDNSHFRVDLVF